MLTRDQILKAKDLKKKKVEVPEWDGFVYVRVMTGKERDSFEQSIVQAKGEVNLENIRARLCALTIVHQAGVKMIADKDIAGHGEKSGRALDRVYKAASKHKRISGKDMEELEKNSGKIRSECSAAD